MNSCVVSLFDETGLAGADWARRGLDVYCYDILHEDRSIKKIGSLGGQLIFEPWDARDKSQNNRIIERHFSNCVFAMSFVPCTDLSVAGAAHFEAKKVANPNYQNEAMFLVYEGARIIDGLDVPGFTENPRSVISTRWREPDYMFHPYEYGGYLPEDDIHPKWPEYITARDAYQKATCLWTSGGFQMPIRKPVIPEEYFGNGYSRPMMKLGGKSQRTKSIRSATPRGFSLANCQTNFRAHKSEPVKGVVQLGLF